ncbi:hypothetical protein GCM10023205_74940 [Yinghuangia aomiensis]|uniref:Protein NO VEIN C-terminal domain-containing protein n=1 Tax=Yinghuangia aomiensis TaxID=676205 RepID=A0ABP9I8U6_9ACTN
MTDIRAAVEVLLGDPGAEVEAEPRDAGEAAEAVRLLDAGLRGGPAAMRVAVERTQETADSLSADRLQVFSELVQNADDAGARGIRFDVRARELVVTHDGRPVRLGDLLLLALPGLSGKCGDPDSTGRFGIGLATLRALSRVWELHCGHYHVRFDGIGMTVADAFGDDGGTVFRIPLAESEICESEVAAWFAGWDDGALLFLRNLREVRVDVGGRLLRRLGLRWSAGESRVRMRVGGIDAAVRMRRAEGAKAAWRVFNAELPCPDGALRRHKAVGARVPVAIALPMGAGAAGVVHAGLPMAALDVPVRVHTQFDPLVSRRDFVDSAWNSAMVERVADLWAAVIPGVLGGDAPTAWHLVPRDRPSPPQPSTATPGDRTTGATAPHSTLLAERLRAALVARARGEVADRLRLACPDGTRRGLKELAVEERRLEGVLGDRPVARQGGGEALFPRASRDRGGRWRRVLADWRAAGVVPLPDEVTVVDALSLLVEETDGDAGGDGLDTPSAIRLAAAALHAGLEEPLLRLPWVRAADGRRHAPPVPGSRHVFVRGAAGDRGPAGRLGMALVLDPAFADESAASRTVVDWLVDRDCVLDGDDVTAVVERVACVGDAGRVFGADDQQLAHMQSMFAVIGEAGRRHVGSRVGRALRFRGHTGQPIPPGALYLPEELDPAGADGFAAAAADTPGLHWLHPDYAAVLPPSADGLSRGAFLRALGVADAPRLVRPGGDGKTYATDRYPGPGLPADAPDTPQARTRALGRVGADHTLDDRDSPDAVAVAAAIAAEPDPERQRARAAKLVHALALAAGRAGGGRRGAAGGLPGVDAAYGYYGWQRKGRVPPLWIWRLREIAWLPRADGGLTRPDAGHLPTAASRVLYGADDPGYLHPDVVNTFDHRDVRGELAPALGLTGDPDVPTLVDRLRELRGRTPDNTPVSDAVTGDAVAVYRALAALLAGGGAEAARAVRAGFPSGDALVLTDAGWRATGAVRQGPSILGGYRTFVFPEPNLRPLWDVLGIRAPDAAELAEVLGDVARCRTHGPELRLGVTLEALRHLAALVAESKAADEFADALGKLPLYTGDGWTTQRPVYAVDNRYVAEQLADTARVWQPGGDLDQFAALLEPLGVTRVDVLGAPVHGVRRARGDARLTAAYRAAVVRLHDLLVRDAPGAASACRDWAWLESLTVRVAPGLGIEPGPPGVVAAVEAHVDPASGVLYVASAASLSTARGAGQAIAACFDRDRTRIGHAWRDVWENQTAPATRLASARQRDAAAARRLDRLVRARENAGARMPEAEPGNAAESGADGRPDRAVDTATGPDRSLSPTPSPPRRLIDVRTLPDPTTIAPRPGSHANAHPPTAEASPHGQERPPAEPPSLPHPHPGGLLPPRRRTSAPAYTAQDRETVAWQLLRIVLRRYGLELHDHRTQPGLGADAVDTAGHFYEIKAHGGPEPREVALTLAEYERALVDGDRFSLVVAANLEEGTGEPRLRIIRDPLRHLRVERTQLIRVTGLTETGDVAVVHEWRTRRAAPAGPPPTGTASDAEP